MFTLSKITVNKESLVNKNITHIRYRLWDTSISRYQCRFWYQPQKIPYQSPTTTLCLWYSWWTKRKEKQES